MELKETIKNRRSIRKYKNTEISKEIIEDLIPLPNYQYASCSHDYSIKIWSGDEPISEFPVNVIDSDGNRIGVLLYMEKTKRLVAGIYFQKIVKTFDIETGELKMCLKICHVSIMVE